MITRAIKNGCDLELKIDTTEHKSEGIGILCAWVAI